MARLQVESTINGEAKEFLCDADQSMLDVLRDELGLTGTKEGCGTGDCGACSILVDGRLVVVDVLAGLLAADAKHIAKVASRQPALPERHDLYESVAKKLFPTGVFHKDFRS